MTARRRVLGGRTTLLDLCGRAPGPGRGDPISAAGSIRDPGVHRQAAGRRGHAGAAPAQSLHEEARAGLPSSPRTIWKTARSVSSCEWFGPVTFMSHARPTRREADVGTRPSVVL